MNFFYVLNAIQSVIMFYFPEKYSFVDAKKIFYRSLISSIVHTLGQILDNYCIVRILKYHLEFIGCNITVVGVWYIYAVHIRAQKHDLYSSTQHWKLEL